MIEFMTSLLFARLSLESVCSVKNLSHFRLAQISIFFTPFYGPKQTNTKPTILCCTNTACNTHKQPNKTIYPQPNSMCASLIATFQ